MSAPIIIAPLTIAALSADGTGSANLLSPNPREVARADDATISIAIDLGAARTVDSVFLGFTNASAGSLLTVTSGVSAPGQTARISNAPFAQSRGAPVWRHALWVAAAPFSARYLNVTGYDPLQGGLFEVGAIAVGAAFRPIRQHEWGSGRSVGDTGERVRLQDGSFGIDPGVATTGWQWTFGDLLDDEVDALYALARDRRQTRSVLVAEDPDQAQGLNERLHWGMFDRLETYERRDDGKTRWSFRIEDW